MPSARPSSSSSGPVIVPTPQCVKFGATRKPLGAVVLIADEKTDPWALTVFRRGLELIGLPEPITAPPTAYHTEVTLTTAVPAREKLLDRCRAEFGDRCTFERLGQEGYLLDVASDGKLNRVTMAAAGGAGLTYAVDTFLQLIQKDETGALLQPALIFDYPAVKIRVYGGSGSLDQAAAMRYNMRGGGGTVEQIEEMRLRHIEPSSGCHPSHASAMHPGLCYSDEEAVEQAITPILEAAKRGVNWVGMNFDDIDLRLPHPEDVKKFGAIGKAQAWFINHTLERVREANPACTLTIIPIIYANNWLPGTWVYAVDEGEIYDYLETLGREVDPSVVFIWTGESVESLNMTDDDIVQWTKIVRRKPIVFENTPTGDLTDFGPLRFRTQNVGDLVLGWIYIHRGPQAQIADFSTAEFLWNPHAYDPEAAKKRAIRRLVGDAAAPDIEKLVAAFSAKDERRDDARYKHPLWREGRLLEIVEPTDPAVADFYVSRLGTISATVPALDKLVWENPFYQAVRKAALASVEIARAYLETYTMIRFAERGDLKEAYLAGDRAEALFEEWNRASSGSTELSANNERRDAMTYIEQVGVARRLRAVRRGGEAPIPWVSAGRRATRLGRPCALLTGPDAGVQMNVKASAGSLKWLVITACGAPNAPIRLVVNGSPIPLPEAAWSPSRWRSLAVSVPPGEGQCRVSLNATDQTEWAVHRIALLEDPSPARLLHATRSSALVGEQMLIEHPTRLLERVTTGQVSGRVAVRTDIDITRGVSGQFLDLPPGTVLGQTFHLPVPGETAIPPKDPIRLITRDSSDGDYLHAIGVMFQQPGAKPLSLVLRRWAGSVKKTLGDAGNQVATTVWKVGTPYGSSHHWVEFRLGVELDQGATYYFELSAPDGWEGWRLRQSYGWYGHRSDPARSAYLNGKVLRTADIPFRTYVWDVYDAEWRK